MFVCSCGSSSDSPKAMLMIGLRERAGEEREMDEREEVMDGRGGGDGDARAGTGYAANSKL